MRRVRPGCCARTATDHAATLPRAAVSVD
jgi:hypothetical protein